jgi:FMN phosphatase YigB (HAD superfamily)
VFIDDVVENVIAAQKMGLKTIQFLNPAQVLSELEILINQTN